MWLIFLSVCFAALCVLIFAWRHTRDRAQIQQHSITAEQLHSLLASSQRALLFDVRLPLDLLAYPKSFLGRTGFRRKKCSKSHH
jgi:hypothetical protein